MKIRFWAASFAAAALCGFALPAPASAAVSAGTARFHARVEGAAHPPAKGAKPLPPSKARADLELARKLKPLADKGDPKAQTDYQAAMNRAKKILVSEGRYGCCITGGCDECAMEMMCPCGQEAVEGKDGDGVCPTCYAGWQQGKGAFDGITLAEIKQAPPMEMGEMHGGGGQMGHMPGMGMSGGDMAHMPGMMGPWSMARDGSGTTWLPDTSPMYGTMSHIGSVQTMLHGVGYGVYTDQGGPRGQTKTYAASQIMGMGWKELPGGAKIGGRVMLSGDPYTMGTRGYPLLFQTGETAFGAPLVDRQHPHDFVMEAALTASLPIKTNKGTLTALGYFAPVGEPALGPTAFPHRPSAFDNPEAPLGHHGLDSTHITYGVGTLGLAASSVKVEGSVFTGREPDEHRFDWDKPRYDSYAGRVFVNPSRNVSLQLSHGFLKSPEAQEPDTNEQRTTASATYNAPLRGETNWQTTLAWGRKRIYEPLNPMRSTDDYLLESAYLAPRYTVFGRLEKADKDELFPLSGSHAKYDVRKFTLGGVQNFAQGRNTELGVGGSVSAYAFPASLKASYGNAPVSFNVFLRVRAGRMR